MKKRNYTNIILLVFIITSIGKAQDKDKNEMTPIGSETFGVIREFFNYDKDIPLDARTVDSISEANYVREKIVFNGNRDSRVPGYLAIPKNGKAPYPCVLQLHGIISSKEEWWKEGSFSSGKKLTQELIDAGFAVLALDAEYHGERLSNNDYESAGVFTFQKGWLQRTRDMIVQTAIEYRRAIDYLSIRSEIDTSRIGIVGYSMGGMMTFILAAIDPRIKVSVACVTPILKDKYSTINVFNFAPYITSQQFLMLMGLNDEFNYSKDNAEQLGSLIKSKTKEILFYKSGHKLPSEWTKKAHDWIEKYLK
jgi:dienelactone hydrolase